MKKLIPAFALAAALLLPLACNPDGGEDCVYTAHTEGITTGKVAVVTRAETSDWKAVNWSAGDKIKVFKASEIKSKDSQGMDFTLTGSAGTPSAQFTATGSGAYNKAKSYAIYPAGIVKGHDGTVVTVELPAVQKYVPDSFSPEAFASVAVGSSKEEMGFLNLCGLLIVKLSSPKAPFLITSLSLTSKGKESLSGEGTVDVNFKELPELTMPEATTEAQKTVTLVCDPPVTLSSDPVFFSFVLPAGSLTKGFTLAVDESVFGRMTASGTALKNTIGRSASRTVSSVLDYEIDQVNPATSLRGIGVAYETAASVILPTPTGTDNGWKIYWGDGSSDDYSPSLSHTYSNPTGHIAAFFSFTGAETIRLNGLSGINTIYINTL